MKLSRSSKAQSSATMPDWKPEIRRRLPNLQLPPTREAAIVEELAQHLDDCSAELLVGGETTDEAYRAARGCGNRFGGGVRLDAIDEGGCCSA
jgi:hypothetical protein